MCMETARHTLIHRRAKVRLTHRYVFSRLHRSHGPIGRLTGRFRLQYDMTFAPDMIPSIYPSPQSSNGEGASSQAAGATKAPAKRKRENRYKNAPPSVLSVSYPKPSCCAHSSGMDDAI